MDSVHNAQSDQNKKVCSKSKIQKKLCGVTRKGGKTHIENTKQLSSTFSLPSKEVLNVTEACCSIVELYTLVGLPSPQPPGWFSQKESLRNKNQIREKTILMNQSLYKFIYIFLSYVKVHGEGSWVKLLKWKFPAFFSFHRSQKIAPLPPINFEALKKFKVPRFPDLVIDEDHWLFKPSTLVGGMPQKYLNLWSLKKTNRDKGYCDKFWTVINSSLQLKKAMPPIPESLIEASIESTIEDLTGVPKVSGPVYLLDALGQAYCVDYHYIGYQCRRSVTELFHDCWCESTDGCFTEEDLFEVFAASSSANYIKSRSKLGAIGELYDIGIFGQHPDCVELGEEEVTFHEPVSPFYGECGILDQKLIDAQSVLGESSDHGVAIVVDVDELKEV